MSEPVRSQELAVEDAGTGSSVLLIHGQPGRAADWRTLATRLRPAHRVLVPDRPGWGATGGPAVGMAANAEAMAELLGARQAGPATVVGHSYGGGVALSLALRHPELVHALVLAGSVGTAAALGRVDRALGRRRLGQLLSAVAVPSLARALTVVQRPAPGRPGGARGRGPGPALRGALAARPLGGMALSVPPGAVPRAWASFVTEQIDLVEETPGLEAALPSLDVPTVVVAGRRDRMVPPRAALDLAGAIPGAALVWVPGAGHLLPFEAAEVLAGVVSRYARQV